MTNSTTETAPPREVALIFCVFFSSFTIISALVFALAVGPLTATGLPSLVTTTAATVQGLAAFIWLRGPLYVGTKMGWSEMFLMWRRGRLPRKAVWFWMAATAMLPATFAWQAGALVGTGEERQVVWGALALSSQVALYLAAMTGLMVSGMQNRSIILQDI
jgi:hypothetical protein